MISPRTRRIVFWLTVAGAIAFVLLPLALCGESPDQAARWTAAKIRPEKSIALDGMVAKLQKLAPQYQRIERLRPNGVPWTVLAGLHMREADNSFRCSLAQGDPLTQRSRNVPRGRIPGVPPPYTWEQCAVDAVYNVDRLDLKDWQTVQGALSAIEGYNGTGYARRDIPSPYLWAGTTVYQRGKFVSDGRFDPNAIDKQLGVAAVLLRMRERGISLPFAP